MPGPGPAHHADTDVGTVDVVVVGAGPAGLYATYYAGFRGLSVAVVDSLEQPGGQISALYPGKLIHDVAGLLAIRGHDLVEACVAQATTASPTWLLGHRAESFDHRADGGFSIGTDHGTRLDARTVIITAGLGTFSPVPLPAAHNFEGRGLVHFVPELDAMRDRDVLIVGGGDSAFDWALNLEPVARSVVLVHRRDRFRAHQATVEQVMASSVRVLPDTEVTAVGGSEQVETVEIVANHTGQQETLKVQAIVAALGFKANLGPLESWGLTIDGRRVPVDQRMRTNIDGVYAAGDIAGYEGKVALISVGFGEAATAVNNAAVHIDPSTRLFPGHSTG